MKGRSTGFTLVELMIVVAVIAIIASLAIPALLNSRIAANEASAIASLRTISTLNERYRVRFTTYAGSLNNLSTSVLPMAKTRGKTMARSPEVTTKVGLCSVLSEGSQTTDARSVPPRAAQRNPDESLFLTRSSGGVSGVTTYQSRRGVAG